MLRPTNPITLKARFFRALGDEGRLTVLEELAGGELRVSDLTSATGMSQSTMSTHLGALHAAGAVERRMDGRSAYYAFAHPAVGAILDNAEEVILSQLQSAYACAQECCQPPA